MAAAAAAAAIACVSSWSAWAQFLVPGPDSSSPWCNDAPDSLLSPCCSFRRFVLSSQFLATAQPSPDQAGIWTVNSACEFALVFVFNKILSLRKAYKSYYYKT